MAEAARLREETREETRSMFKCQLCAAMFGNDYAHRMPHLLQC